jgi:hypothetical protein
MRFSFFFVFFFRRMIVISESKSNGNKREKELFLLNSNANCAVGGVCVFPTFLFSLLFLFCFRYSTQRKTSAQEILASWEGQLYSHWAAAGATCRRVCSSTHVFSSRAVLSTFTSRQHLFQRSESSNSHRKMNSEKRRVAK